jgi:hypothetical protein
MRVFDNHGAVVGWASEPIAIPYLQPYTGKWARYYPDFLVIYRDVQGKQHAELIEVKPARQTFEHATRSKRDRGVLAINMAKWKAATDFCKNRGMNFRIMTENEIYRNPAMR